MSLPLNRPRNKLCPPLPVHASACLFVSPALRCYQDAPAVMLSCPPLSVPATPRRPHSCHHRPGAAPTQGSLAPSRHTGRPRRSPGARPKAWSLRNVGSRQDRQPCSRQKRALGCRSPGLPQPQTHLPGGKAQPLAGEVPHVKSHALSLGCT